MNNNNYAFKCKTPNKGQFEITQCWKNYTFSLHYGAVKMRYNICRIIPHTSDTNVDGIISEQFDDVTFEYTSSIILFIKNYIFKAWNKIFFWMRTVTLP